VEFLLFIIITSRGLLVLVVGFLLLFLIKVGHLEGEPTLITTTTTTKKEVNNLVFSAHSQLTEFISLPFVT
jgi:hypothetical protein